MQVGSIQGRQIFANLLVKRCQAFGCYPQRFVVKNAAEQSRGKIFIYYCAMALPWLSPPGLLVHTLAGYVCAANMGRAGRPDQCNSLESLQHSRAVSIKAVASAGDENIGVQIALNAGRTIFKRRFLQLGEQIKDAWGEKRMQ
jgi:hypothetical protein